MKNSTKNVIVMYRICIFAINPPTQPHTGLGGGVSINIAKYIILSDREEYCEGKLKRKWSKNHGEKIKKSLFYKQLKNNLPPKGVFNNLPFV